MCVSKDKSPQPPPPRDPARPPHDLRDPTKVKTKEDLAKDERRRRKRRKERSMARKRDDGFNEDEDPPPTPPTEHVAREPQGVVGQRPREGYPCDMTEGWRELRVYLSAYPQEMNCTLLSLLSLFRDLRPITDPRRIKIVPVLIPHPLATGRGVGGGLGGGGGGASGRMGKEEGVGGGGMVFGGLSVVGRMRELERCHVIILLQGDQEGEPIRLFDHLCGGMVAPESDDGLGEGGGEKKETEVGGGGKEKKGRQEEREVERERERCVCVCVCVRVCACVCVCVCV